MNNNKKNNNLPLAIIGLVLVVAVVGGWWFYNNSKANSGSTVNNVNKPTGSPTKMPTPPPSQVPANAPPGAQPPHALGSPNATVIVEEFADFQCPTCASVHGLMKNIQALYGGRINFIFRHYPLTTIHAKAYDAAVAAEAAGLQGKFWDMQNLLFINQQAWVASNEHRKLFEEYAQRIGLDVAKFQDDMLGMRAKIRVDADMQRGRAINISSTPTILVNNRSVPFEQMTLEGMRAIIDGELQKSQAGQVPTGPGSSSGAPANSTNSSANKK